MKGKKTGGRKKGVPNKATADIKAIASVYGPAAIKKLAEMAGLIKGDGAAESEQARVAAVKEILDRGYGKSPQAVVGDDENPLTVLHRIERVIVDSANPNG